jgi:two-component system sensor histidine kinase UhpB
VSLVLSEPERMLYIEVADDGSGFDTASASEGIGIIGTRERVYALRGTIDLSSKAGNGTVVAIALPLDGATAVS